MEYEQLKEDKIYHCDWTAGNYKYIFRKKSREDVPNKNWTGIDVTSNSYFEYRGDFTTGVNFREATPEEIEHFLQCDKAKRYVKYTQETLSEYLLFN